MITSAARNSNSGKSRQYILLAVLGAIVLYFGVDWASKSINRPIEEARAKTARLKKDIEERTKKLRWLQEASKLHLTRWTSQSLPGDKEVARSLYRAWLLELVNDVKLLNPSVKSSEPAPRKGLYHTLSFSVQALGTLEQLKIFLFAFYQTDLLHQIRSLSITPLSQGNQLNLSMSIEALMLDHVAAGDRSKDPQTVFEEFRQRCLRVSNRLASEKLDDYDVIDRRNLFGMGIGGTADPMDHTYLTSIIFVNGEPEVWFDVRTTNEVKKVPLGEKFEIGSLVCTIAEVHGSSDVIIECDGERWLLTLEDKITDAHALPPEF